MCWSRGSEGLSGSFGDLLRRAARWAWERDEVGQTVTRERIAYVVLLYGGLFVLSFAVGTVLWLDGQPVRAFTVWIVGNGITAFFGTIAIGWDALEYREARRDEGRDEDAEDSRPELAPDLELHRDAKISFLITLALIGLLAGSVLLADLLL